MWGILPRMSSCAWQTTQRHGPYGHTALSCCSRCVTSATCGCWFARAESQAALHKAAESLPLQMALMFCHLVVHTTALLLLVYEYVYMAVRKWGKVHTSSFCCFAACRSACKKVMTTLTPRRICQRGCCHSTMRATLQQQQKVSEGFCELGVNTCI